MIAMNLLSLKRIVILDLLAKKLTQNSYHQTDYCGMNYLVIGSQMDPYHMRSTVLESEWSLHSLNLFIGKELNIF